MTRSKLPSEGSVFLVPLSDSDVGFAIGVLVRTDGEGRAYGVFFGPRVRDERDVALHTLFPENGILCCRFGDYGLHTGRWRVIGRIPSWNRERWRLPQFARRHDKESLRYIVEYDDSLNVRSEQIVSADEARALPQDAQFGSAVVEGKLRKLL